MNYQLDNHTHVVMTKYDDDSYLRLSWSLISDVTRALEASGTMGGASAADIVELPVVWCEATQLPQS